MLGSAGQSSAWDKTIFALQRSTMAGETHAGWIELRDALGEEPGELAFRAVASILDTWPGDDTKDAAVIR